jgi:hypothetical protein
LAALLSLPPSIASVFLFRDCFGSDGKDASKVFDSHTPPGSNVSTAILASAAGIKVSIAIVEGLLSRNVSMAVRGIDSICPFTPWRAADVEGPTDVRFEATLPVTCVFNALPASFVRMTSFAKDGLTPGYCATLVASLLVNDVLGPMAFGAD